MDAYRKGLHPLFKSKKWYKAGYSESTHTFKRLDISCIVYGKISQYHKVEPIYFLYTKVRCTHSSI